MYICKKRNAHIHWWGETIVIIGSNGYYKLSNLETFMVQKVMQNNNMTSVVYTISDELNVNIDETEKFVLKFINNYKEVFEVNKFKQDNIGISGEKGKFYPIELHVSLTSMCNQKCIHCYKNAGVKNENIDHNKLVAFLKYMEGKVPFLTLSGGDALMYPYIEDILELFGGKYQICVMTSGYSITPSQICSLKRASRGVYISVYSSQPKVHNAFVKTQNSYERIFDNIRKLRSEDISVGISTLLKEENSNDITNLIESLIPMGVERVSLGTIFNLGRARDNNLQIPNSDRMYEQMRLIQEQYKDIVVLQEDGNGIKRRILSPFKCMAGSLLWCVYENGEIYPCGTCKNEKLLMGDIDDYMPCVDNIISYYDKISKLPLIKKMDPDKCNCPFEEKL